mgnify:CR=1 FL=1
MADMELEQEDRTRWHRQILYPLSKVKRLAMASCHFFKRKKIFFQYLIVYLDALVLTMHRSCVQLLLHVHTSPGSLFCLEDAFVSLGEDITASQFTMQS